MKRYLIFGGVVIALLIVASLFLSKESPTSTSTDTLPTILVTSGEITLSQSNTERPVASGEQIPTPFTLKSNSDSTAVVRLGEGSELRLDKSSILTVTDASYNTETKNLVVSTKLTIGRVWSNIIALATPESSWEVETSNVVGTVRGSAFGVEAYENGDTTITGSEHVIELILKNPDTGERDPERKIMLSEEDFVTISDDVGRDTGKGTPTPKKKTGAERSNPWVRQNEALDRGEPPQQNSGGDAGQETLRGEDEILPEIQEILTQPEPKVLEIAPAVPPKAKPVSITVSPSVPLRGIVEGTSVDLTATLTYSDGTTRDVSREVAWGVVGDIGAMRGSLFSPLLSAKVSELGRAMGSIGATWKNSETGEQLYGATEIFEVKAKIIPLGTVEG